MSISDTNQSAAGGCATVVTVVMGVLLMLMVFYLLVLSVPHFSADTQELCWTVDVAFPWEQEAYDQYACVTATVRVRGEK